MIALNQKPRKKLEEAVQSGNAEILSRVIKEVAQEDDPLGFAIQKAIEEQTPVSELEALGVAERVCNMLEKRAIFTIEDLLNTSDERLLKISNMGQTCLSKIKLALQRLPELEDAWEEYIGENGPDTSEMERIKSGWGTFETDLRAVPEGC